MLRQALQRHRLTFLWYAHPAHYHVPGHESPDKSDLYERIGLAGCNPAKPRPAEDIFEFANGINTWLREQQNALGVGHGKALETNPWPASHYAFWEFEQATPTPLQANCDLIARMVGDALQSPRPDWLDADDVAVVRQCERLASPVPTEQDMGGRWGDLPLIVWDYPDRLERQADALTRLVLMEQGTTNQGTAAIRPGGVPTHSPDFTTLNAFGTTYRFSKGQQAEAVRVLWKAYETGKLTLSEETVGEKIGSTSDRFRLAHVFRTKRKGGGYAVHEAWNTLIYSPQKGVYAIQDPHGS